VQPLAPIRRLRQARPVGRREIGTSRVQLTVLKKTRKGADNLEDETSAPILHIFASLRRTTKTGDGQPCGTVTAEPLAARS
jgi:hypothetical protein